MMYIVLTVCCASRDDKVYRKMSIGYMQMLCFGDLGTLGVWYLCGTRPLQIPRDNCTAIVHVLKIHLAQF